MVLILTWPFSSFWSCQTHNGGQTPGLAARPRDSILNQQVHDVARADGLRLHRRNGRLHGVDVVERRRQPKWRPVRRRVEEGICLPRQTSRLAAFAEQRV